MTIPFVDLAAGEMELSGELEEALVRVAASGRYLLGPELEAFEREFAAYCEARHCVGVASGLSALELILGASGIGEGDEVIVPAHTFIATWLAVRRAGARPVGADVLPGSHNLDPEAAAAVISPRTTAIIPVHMRGEPAAMTAIRDLGAANGLRVIEDAAQAHGARYRGARVGSLAHAAGFSFYPTKNLGALGDGGAIVTDDDDLAERARMLRNYGMRDRRAFELPGTNSRLADIQAAALRVKLRRLDGWNGARRALAARYAEGLADLPIELPQPAADAEPVWHLFCALHPDRDSLCERLAAAGIETLVHYPTPPHLTAVFADLGLGEATFPVAERIAFETLSLPMFPQLGEARADEVIGALTRALAT